MVRGKVYCERKGKVENCELKGWDKVKGRCESGKKKNVGVVSGEKQGLLDRRPWCGVHG